MKAREQKLRELEHAHALYVEVNGNLDEGLKVSLNYTSCHQLTLEVTTVLQRPCGHSIPIPRRVQRIR